MGLTDWIYMGTIATVVLVVVVLLILAVLIGKFIKGNRSEVEQRQEDNDQAASLARIDKPHSRVDDFSSPVTGRYERKTDKVTPHGSRKVVSSTPGLAGAGPLKRRDDDLAIGGMTGLGYGASLGYDSDLDGVPNSVDPVYSPVDLNEYDRTVTNEDGTANSLTAQVEAESTVTEPAHVVEDAVVVSEPTPAYTPEPSYSAPEPSYSAPEPSYSAPDTSYSAPSDSGTSSF